MHNKTVTKIVRIQIDLEEGDPRLTVIDALLESKHPPVAEILRSLKPENSPSQNGGLPTPYARLRLFAAYRDKGNLVHYPDGTYALHREVFPEAPRRATALYHKSLGYFVFDQTASTYTTTQKAMDELQAWEGTHGPVK